MRPVLSATLLLLPLTLAACAHGPNDTWSLRANIADAIAPSGYDPNRSAQLPQPAPPPAPFPPALQGSPVAGISQVAIIGGQVRVSTGGMFSQSSGWRDHATIDTVSVAECGATPIELGRTDKLGTPLTIYASRVQGIIYIGPYASQGCTPPPESTGYPTWGRFPLQVHDRVQSAVVQIDAIR